MGDSGRMVRRKLAVRRLAIILSAVMVLPLTVAPSAAEGASTAMLRALDSTIKKEREAGHYTKVRELLAIKYRLDPPSTPEPGATPTAKKESSSPGNKALSALGYGLGIVIGIPLIAVACAAGGCGGGTGRRSRTVAVGGVKANAYGLGVNSDQSGRPHTYRTQDGQSLGIFNSGVKRNGYGLGVHQDRFGRPVYDR